MRFYTRFVILLFFLISCQQYKTTTPVPVMALLNSEQKKIENTQLIELQQAGFNIVATPFVGLEQNFQWLALADSLGLKLVLADQRIDQFMQNPQKQEMLDSMITDYSIHSSFFGYYTFDKPDSNMYSRFANSIHYLNAHDPEHPAVVNMLPLHRQNDINGLNYFYRDLWNLVDRVSPRLICFEQFPVFTADTDYYQNLEILKSICLEQDIPWWATVTQTHHFSPAVEKSQLDVQFYSVLAYGAKGIAYYPNAFEQDNKEDIIPDINRSESTLTHIRYLNKVIQSFAPFLNDLSSVGVFHTDPVPRGCVSLKAGLPLVNIVGKQFLTGIYKRDNHYWIWLVNKNIQTGAVCKLFFDEKVKHLQQMNLGLENTDIDLENNRFQCELIFKAGEGRLLELDMKE